MDSPWHFQNIRNPFIILVILTSTASGRSLISVDAITQAMKNRPAKPLFLIDASVPRNIDEAVAKTDNVFLYNMDDVSAIANET